MKTLILTIILFAAPHLFAQEVPSVVSGCKTTDYLLGDLESSIGFQGMSYTPRCLQVVVGSKVTIAASKNHPLLPQSQAKNPIGEAEAPQTYTFNEVGVFGYFCDRHGNAAGEGMAGAIWVVEQ